MPISLEAQSQGALHPVDLIEHIASINDYSFEREEADEISISVRGGWSDYYISFTWINNLESLHIACSFDLKVPDERVNEVSKLISKVNSQLWIGHFDFRPNEGIILFRHSHMLSGGADISALQCEVLLRTASEICDTYYQAFQFVLWAEKDADFALASAMFETQGEA